CPVSDAALGLVEDAAKVDVVVGVVDHPHIRQRVLDLFAVVEAGAADDPVGDAAVDQPLLQGSRLGVGAVEDGDVGGAHTVLVAQRVDGPGDPFGLVSFASGSVQDHGGAVGVVRPEGLLSPGGDLADHRIGGG